MSVANLNHDRVIVALANLGHEFILTSLGQTAECLSMHALRAASAGEVLRGEEHAHLLQCTRCSAVVAAFRSIQTARRKPSSWKVKLVDICFPSETDWSYEVLGRISLATDRFNVCENESEWTPHPLAMRVNMILDPGSGLLTVTILEAPSEVSAISMTIDGVALDLRPGQIDGTYELVKELGAIGSTELGHSFESLVDTLESGAVELVFERNAGSFTRATGATSKDMLVEEGIIEHAADYCIPCGKHSDTFVNVAKLCHSEGSLARVAAALGELFADAAFDTIVTNGWAMATVARRLALLSRRAGARPIREIMCEGYDPPTPTEDICAQSRVLVLVDVAVTGSLLERLRRIVEQAGATVVAMGSIAKASVAKLPDTTRFLSTVEMRLDEPRKCPRCGVLELLEFNAYANCMTVKLANARSPSQFMAYNDEAREFWEFVNTADAYEKHHIERNCHYTAYVDTVALLAHPDIGPALVENLRGKVLAHQLRPTAFLVPARHRAELLAERLAECSEFASPTGRAAIVLARRRNDAWRLTDSARRLLQGQRVLVVDSAAGYGRTIDYLAMTATRACAKSVGAAVILSRLPEACEASLRSRLSGGFFRLYHLPIRPVVIRGNDAALCWFCRRKAAVRDAAKESGLEAIHWWADRLSQSSRSESASSTPGSQARNAGEQPSLFPIPTPSFLERCRGSVAGGVTLHSLHAAMRNGMAPLALPEIRDETIPAKNRTAMVESLPPGIVEWSRGFLEQDLFHFLGAGRTPSVWRASAEVLARETGAKWIGHLRDILQHAKILRQRPMPTFWNSLACDAYLVVHRSPETKPSIQGVLKGLMKDYDRTAAGSGLRQILAATGA